VKISQRVQDLAESGTIAVSNKVAAMRAQGIDVVSLGAGEPDFDTPDHIKAAAAEALGGGETKYAKPASGVPELKQAVVAKLQRENGLTYSTDQVVASVGGKEALYLAFATLLDPGDEVIIPAPYWVSYPEQVKLAGGVPVFVNAGADAGFRITPDQLRDALSPRTRVLVFNSPSNPTGAAYSPEETDALAEVLADTDVVTFSDEMYDRLLFGGRTFKSFAATSAHAYDHTITFNAGSKTYSMTGWRIGYAAGPVDVIKGMAKIQSQSTSNPSSISHAAMAALDGPQDSIPERRAVFQERRDLVVSMLNQAAGIECATPEGAFYLYISCAGAIGRKTPDGATIGDDTDFVTYLLESEGVAVVQGAAFGLSPYFRISYAASNAELEEACRRIQRACASLA